MIQLISVVLYCCLSVSVESLDFPDAYYAKGNIYLPYGDIAEPFEAWVDIGSGESRLDTYDGTAKVINFGKRGSYGTMYKIVPMTNNNVTNQITCFKVEGNKNSSIVPQGVLPNASLYEYVHDQDYNGIEVSVYISYFMENDRENNYTLLVRKNDSVPVVIHFLGYDRLFGSHYDEYSIVYSAFDNRAPHKSVFEYEQGFKCIGFPGPGINYPMAENPFFEFFGASSYSFVDQRKGVDEEFKHFCTKHRKEYKNEQELSQKKNIFKHNLRFIHSFNRQHLSFKLAINHMADYSIEELKVMRGVSKRADSPRRNGSLSSDRDVPSSWNWWLEGAVTPVKDQGICGSCWSFGTTGTLEGSYFLKHGKLVSLSEQSLIDCSWGFGNNGCDGGESERSYMWIMKSGCLPTESSYGQYLMQDGMCHFDEAECGVQVRDWHNTPQGDVKQLVEAIYFHGPISIAIDASHLSFAFYSNGVYFEPKCGDDPKDLDHQVLAVGYGELNGSKYVIVKNSWSTHWGNDGYILMSQENNNCGIATDASFADVM